MKILLWFALPMVFLALYFVVPQSKNQPETASESKVPETEEEPAATLKPVSLSVSPATIIQGEPVLITIDGLASVSAIQSLTLDDKPLAVFVDEGKLAALVGIDLHRTPGSYPITLTLADGRVIEEKMKVGQRTMATTEFDIPEQLGGNTPQAEQELTNTLAQDTVTLNAITATISPEKLWDGRFRLPLTGSPTVTDVYGYSRQTGSVNLSHNGTDFRAPVGTPVYAMNSGTIVFAGSFRNYGNTVIIDHGLGLMTMYMHLSEIDVELDNSVKQGDLIARSGNTGYSLGPHLHLSVRMDGFSIDPEKFLELMGSR
ncbi:MAG: M23 family metallopeptidase [Candidatus Moranbacteria bacterium]|nr:M23 family metallopeptidase [Candidatus Moranbacteria bacterium]